MQFCNNYTVMHQNCVMVFCTNYNITHLNSVRVFCTNYTITHLNSVMVFCINYTNTHLNSVMVLCTNYTITHLNCVISCYRQLDLGELLCWRHARTPVQELRKRMCIPVTTCVHSSILLLYKGLGVTASQWIYCLRHHSPLLAEDGCNCQLPIHLFWQHFEIVSW